MSKLINRLFGVLLMLGFSVASPIAAAADPVPLDNKSFTIKSVVAPFGQNHFLIKVTNGANNNSGCGDDPTLLIVPRVLPQFSEMVSLATAAMLAGKTIVVSAVRIKPCNDEFNRAQIDHLEVLN